MDTDQLSALYRVRKKETEERISRHNRMLRLLGALRLGAMILTIWFIVLAIRDIQAVFFLFAVLAIVLFLFLVLCYVRQKDLRDLNKQIRDLNLVELDCLSHQFRHLDDGAIFSNPSHSWSHDLDLFGTGSLFQYMNRSSTGLGRARLAKKLCEEAPSPGDISDRQELLKDLRDRIDFRQTFSARGSMLDDQTTNLDDIKKWLNTDAYIKRRTWLFFVAAGMSLLSLAAIVSGFFIPGNFKFLLPILFINFAFLSPFLMRTNRYQESISRKHSLLRGYAILLGLIAEEDFSHPSLIKDSKAAAKGKKEVRRLSKLLNLFDQRLSMLLGPILNGLFLFDFIMLYFLEKWKTKNSSDILHWIEITTSTDAGISLAGFAFNHQEFSWPELGITDSPIKLKSLGHPLISPEKRVNNDLQTEKENTIIITGANMAGKSTFLRSLGINMVLAYTGCPVCAEQFSMPFMGLVSSMRTADSLAEEESYFFAEIKRLQSIVQRMESGTPLLILLDEVLKGTNTTDKKKGSVGLIERCLRYPVRCFIATHDLSLGEMEARHPGKVANYCFESYIDKLELSFDYTIRKGLATNMNASFLMKKMGIMD